MGRARKEDKNKMFYREPECTIESHLSAQDRMGPREGRTVLRVGILQARRYSKISAKFNKFCCMHSMSLKNEIIVERQY